MQSTNAFAHPYEGTWSPQPPTWNTFLTFPRNILTVEEAFWHCDTFTHIAATISLQGLTGVSFHASPDFPLSSGKTSLDIHKRIGAALLVKYFICPASGGNNRMNADCCNSFISDFETTKKSKNKKRRPRVAAIKMTGMNESLKFFWLKLEFCPTWV